MKQIKHVIYPAILIVGALSGCEYNNPLEQEQYNKQVYIVGANQSNNEGMSVGKLAYTKSETEEVETYISIGVGGSLTIDRDISVKVDEAGNEAIKNYNYLYRFSPGDILYQKLGSSFYRIPDNTVKVKAGEAYGRMPFFIKTAGLECDSLYALTFKIASASDPDYVSIRKTDTVLIFTLSLVNDYSGTYQEQGVYSKVPSTLPSDTISLSAPRTLKAINYNTVRFIHLANSEVAANIAPYGVTVKIGNDNTLTISPWGTLAITAGGGTYDPVNQVFRLWYNYTSGGVSYKFAGNLVRSGS